MEVYVIELDQPFENFIGSVVEFNKKTNFATIELDNGDRKLVRLSEMFNIETHEPLRASDIEIDLYVPITYFDKNVPFKLTDPCSYHTAEMYKHKILLRSGETFKTITEKEWRNLL
jgi:hypothetical protein